MKHSRSVVGIILLVYLVLALFAWVNLPSVVNVHWDANGNPNGTATKLWGIGIFPLIGVFIYGIFTLIPRLDPKGKNIAQFANEYTTFTLVMQGFFLYIFVLFIASNMGYDFPFLNALAPAMAALTFYLGVLLTHAKQNYFIGIRTPWTLANEKVWNETHTRTGKLLKIVAFLPLFGLIAPKGDFVWIIAPLVVPLVYGGALSYVLYRKYVK